MRILSLLALLFQIRPDPVHQNELIELSLRAQTKAAEEEQALRVRRQQQLFEQRFNALVAAVEAFAKDYNQSKGHAWSKRRIDELRSAIEKLQDAEPALRGKTSLNER